MTEEEREMFERWKYWIMLSVSKKFEDRSPSIQMLSEAREYILDLIGTTFEGDPDWANKIDVETGMDGEAEKPYFRIVLKEQE
jgi:hypothetical protein